MSRRERLSTAALALLAISVVAAVVYSIFEVLRFRYSAPYQDMVTLEYYLNTRVVAHGFDLSSAASLHSNEHRPVFPMAFWIIDHVLFKSAGLFLVILNLILTAGITGLMGLMTWRAGGPRASTAALLPLVPLALFWPAHWENLIWPMQVHVFLAICAVLVGLISLVRADRLLFAGKPRSELLVSTIAGLSALFVALFSFGYGLIAWILVAPFMLARRWPRWLCMWVLIFIVAGLGLYGSSVTFVPQHASPIDSIKHPASLATYTFMFVGAPIHFIIEGLSGRYEHVWSTLAGAAGIISFAVFVLHTVVRPRIANAGPSENARLFFLCVATWAIGVALATALFRLNFGVEQSLMSRYLIVSCLFWLSLSAYGLGRVQHCGRFVIGLFIAGTVAVGVAIASTFSYYADVMAERARNVRIGALAAIMKVPSAASGYGLLPSEWDWITWSVLDDAARRGASIYNQAWPYWLGHRVDELFARANSGRCGSYIDQIVSAGNNLSKTAGWVWDASNRVAPEWLVIADASDMIVGLATSGAVRHDVATALRERGAIRAGWEGFARVSPDKVHGIYAILGDGQACRLVGPSR